MSLCINLGKGLIWFRLKDNFERKPKDSQRILIELIKSIKECWFEKYHQMGKLFDYKKCKPTIKITLLQITDSPPSGLNSKYSLFCTSPPTESTPWLLSKKAPNKKSHFLTLILKSLRSLMSNWTKNRWILKTLRPNTQ